MVAGSLTHTLSLPTCPGNDDAEARVPTFAQLDAGIAIRSDRNMSGVDVVGARYWRAGSVGGGRVWRTSEVVRLRPRDTYLFAPSWFHRVVPPHVASPRAPVTLVAKLKLSAFELPDATDDRRAARRASVLEPTNEYNAEPDKAKGDEGVEPYRVCWLRRDLVRALREATDLDVRLGLPKLRCTSQPQPVDGLGFEPRNLLHLAKEEQNLHRGVEL
jgi:hypothetical protein